MHQNYISTEKDIDKLAIIQQKPIIHKSKYKSNKLTTDSYVFK